VVFYPVGEGPFSEMLLMIDFFMRVEYLGDKQRLFPLTLTIAATTSVHNLMRQLLPHPPRPLRTRLDELESDFWRGHNFIPPAS
jgi:hypothetical protein